MSDNWWVHRFDGLAMARLRFPGRPGYRFGRLGIKYGPDHTKPSFEFGFKLITNVQRGLHYFHELYGESDEVSRDASQKSLHVCILLVSCSQ